MLCCAILVTLTHFSGCNFYVILCDYFSYDSISTSSIAALQLVFLLSSGSYYNTYFSKDLVEEVSLNNRLQLLFICYFLTALVLKQKQIKASKMMIVNNDLLLVVVYC